MYEPAPKVLVMGRGPRDTHPSIGDYLGVPTNKHPWSEVSTGPELKNKYSQAESDVVADRRQELSRRLAIAAVGIGDYGNVIRRLSELQEVDPHNAFELTSETIVEVDLRADSPGHELAGQVLAQFMGNLIRESVITDEHNIATPIFSEEHVLSLVDKLSPHRLGQIALALEGSKHHYIALASYYEVVGPADDSTEDIESGMAKENASDFDEKLVSGLEAKFSHVTSPELVQQIYESIPDIPERNIALDRFLAEKIRTCDVLDIEGAFGWLQLRKHGEGADQVVQAYDSNLLMMAKAYYSNYPRRPDVMYLFITDCSPQLDSTIIQLWQLVRDAAEILKETTKKDPRMPDGTLIPIPTPDTQRTQSPPLSYSNKLPKTENLPILTDEQVEAIRRQFFSERIIKIIPSPEEAKERIADFPDDPKLLHVYNQFVLERMLEGSFEKMVAWFNVRLVDKSSEDMFKRVFDDRLDRNVRLIESDGNSQQHLIALLMSYTAHSEHLRNAHAAKLNTALERFRRVNGYKWQPMNDDGQVRFF